MPPPPRTARDKARAEAASRRRGSRSQSRKQSAKGSAKGSGKPGAARRTAGPQRPMQPSQSQRKRKLPRAKPLPPLAKKKPTSQVHEQRRAKGLAKKKPR